MEVFGVGMVRLFLFSSKKGAYIIKETAVAGKITSFSTKYNFIFIFSEVYFSGQGS